MFRTFTEGEITSMAVFSPGAKHWNLVELRGPSAFFLVSFSPQGEDEEVTRLRSVLLADVFVLREFLSQSDGHSGHLTVHAMLRNGRDWEFERVTGVLVGSEPTHKEHLAYVLRHQSGPATVLSSFGTTEPELVDLCQLCDLSPSADQAPARDLSV